MHNPLHHASKESHDGHSETALMGRILIGRCLGHGELRVHLICIVIGRRCRIDV